MRQFYVNSGMSLADKVIWITGASSGIGAATALELSKQKTELILSARTLEKLEEVQALCTANGATCHVLAIDLSKTDTHLAIAEEAWKLAGRIDVLFNNAGISQRELALETDLEVDRRVMEVNFFGTVSLSKAVAPMMLKAGGGHIALNTSIVGKIGFPLRTAYAASKHALHGFFDSWRAELDGQNLDITLICPGRTNTPISLSALRGDGSTHGEVDDWMKNGMTAESVAKRIVKAIRRKEKEVYIGSKESLLVYIRRYFPPLYYRIVTRVKAQ